MKERFLYLHRQHARQQLDTTILVKEYNIHIHRTILFKRAHLGLYLYMKIFKHYFKEKLLSIRKYLLCSYYE